MLVRSVTMVRGMWDYSILRRASINPEEAQKAWLMTRIRNCQSTVIGKKYKFESIHTPSEFAKRVPILDYEGHRPYVERMIKGEQNVLTDEIPFMYGSTSGTSDKPKLVPVTPSTRKDLAAIGRIFLYRALKDHPRVLDHRLLSVVSPMDEAQTPLGLPIGAMSGLTYSRVPALVRQSFPIPYDIFRLSNYELRYRLICQFAVGHRISFIAVPNPTTLLKLVQVLKDNIERLISTVRDGGLGLSPGEMESLNENDAAICKKYESVLKPSPRRASFLEASTRQSGNFLPRNIWPELDLIACWLGGSAGIQAADLAVPYGENVSLRDLGLRATEGTMTIPMRDGVPSGVLPIHTGYFEFIPEQEKDHEKPAILGAHQLEVGKTYHILLTTSGGLWRYDINDIVRMEGHHGATPILAFLRKGKDMANITGEKIHVNQLLLSLESTGKDLRMPFESVVFIPNISKSRYEVLLELKDPNHSTEAIRKWGNLLDKALCKVNVEYDQKRKSGRLNIPVINRMKPGWGYRRRDRHIIIQGRRDTQYKWNYIDQEMESADRLEIGENIHLEDVDSV